MRSVVGFWVHLSYSRDLQELGFKPFLSGPGPYDKFLLPRDEWDAFRSMYKPSPTLYEDHPNCED